MVFGIGFDLVEIWRIERALNRWGDRFLDKVLTINEKRGLPSDLSRYVASRFAAKEATVKALGTGFSKGISFKDIEVVSLNGPPEIKLLGRAFKIQDELGIRKIFLSISHEKNIAGAMVVIEC
jgi:holo-[acyl-carrier protein] synthase